MQHDIPQEQMERIRPLVDRFLSAFHQLESTLSIETDSALTYQVKAEDGE